jgi:flagellar biosynthesis/type III secretory pathway chaperone
MQEVAQLKQQNALNQELIRQSLDVVNLSLQLFQPDSEPVTYDHPNQTSSSQYKGNPLFDSKA